MLIPWEDIKKVITAKNDTKYLEVFIESYFKFIIFFVSTIIKLETAFIIVSMLLTVNEMAIKIIVTEIIKSFLFKTNEKKAKSGTTFGFKEIATNPENPKIKTIGIIIKKAKIKLLFRVAKFFAAYTLCQLP